MIVFNLDALELTYRKSINIKFKIDKAQIEDTVNAFIYDKVTKRQTEQHFN